MSKPSEIPLTKSKWSAEELHFKTVEFKIPRGDFIIQGIGQFFASENNEGFHRVELVTDEPHGHPSNRLQTRYALPQATVDRIEIHPDQAVAEFRLM